MMSIPTTISMDSINNVKQILARLRKLDGSTELMEFIQNFTWLIFYVEASDSEEIHLWLTTYNIQAELEFNTTGCTVHPNSIPSDDRVLIQEEDINTLTAFVECVRRSYTTKVA